VSHEIILKDSAFSLSFTCLFIFQSHGVDLLGRLSCTSENLGSLHLLTHFCDIDAILSTFTLLRNASNLNDLEIEVHIFLCSCKITWIAWFSYFLGAPHFILVIVFALSKINYNGDQEIEANAEFQNAQWVDGMCRFWRWMIFTFGQMRCAL
jgi:hypothetical protein